MRQRSRGNPGPSWDVVRLEGAPRVGWHSLGEKSGPGRRGIGQPLVTTSTSRAGIPLDERGRVEVDPGSRLRLVTNGPGRKRLSLERGTIHAVIWAPPGQFVVDTPSAVAVDLGCVYTLHVDDSGAGLLRDRKSTRLNSSHLVISYAVFCLKNKMIAAELRARLRAMAGDELLELCAQLLTTYVIEGVLPLAHAGESTDLAADAVGEESFAQM